MKYPRISTNILRRYPFKTNPYGSYAGDGMTISGGAIFLTTGMFPEDKDHRAVFRDTARRRSTGSGL
jgi:hypothetical protein